MLKKTLCVFWDVALFRCQFLCSWCYSDILFLLCLWQTVVIFAHLFHILLLKTFTLCQGQSSWSRYRQPFLASRGNPYLTVNIPVFSELDPLILWTRVVKFYMAVKTKSSVSTLCCLILCSFVDADNICDEKYPLLPKKVPWRRTRRPYLSCQFRQCMNFSPKRVRLTSNRSTNSFVEEMGHSSSSSY